MSKKKRRSRGQARTKQQKGPSLVIPIIVGVVVLAMAVGVIIFSESRQPASAGAAGGSAQRNTAQPLSTRSIPHPDVPRISLEETQDQLEQGQAILVDVRSKASYDRAHAAGAVSIPEEEIATRLDELPRDKDIILYCT